MKIKNLNYKPQRIADLETAGGLLKTYAENHPEKEFLTIPEILQAVPLLQTLNQQSALTDGEIDVICGLSNTGLIRG